MCGVRQSEFEIDLSGASNRWAEVYLEMNATD
jgi:hypothetical protein